MTLDPGHAQLSPKVREMGKEPHSVIKVLDPKSVVWWIIYSHFQSKAFRSVIYIQERITFPFVQKRLFLVPYFHTNVPICSSQSKLSHSIWPLLICYASINSKPNIGLTSTSNIGQMLNFVWKWKLGQNPTSGWFQNQTSGWFQNPMLGWHPLATLDTILVGNENWV